MGREICIVFQYVSWLIELKFYTFFMIGQFLRAIQSQMREREEERLFAITIFPSSLRQYVFPVPFFIINTETHIIDYSMLL